MSQATTCPFSAKPSSSGGVFDRFPKATLILGHMGESLPYQLWRLDSRSQLYQTRIKKAPSQYVRENIFITISGVFDFPPLLCALLAPGSDRVLFSIDYPFESTKDAVEFIECAPLSQGGFAGRTYPGLKPWAKIWSRRPVSPNCTNDPFRTGSSYLPKKHAVGESTGSLRVRKHLNRAALLFKSMN